MILRRLTKHVKDQNWFAVGLDFLIVVLGVGFAMIGQHWLSERQQQADLELAERVLQIELVANYYVAKERVAISQCRVEAYRAVAEQLLEPGVDWTGMPREVDEEVFRNALPTLLRSPSRSWGSRTWQAELSRGTFNKMDDDRRNMLDSIFRQAASAEALQNDIFALQGRVNLLAVSTQLSQSDRLRYYDVLGELDNNSALLELMAHQIAVFIEEVGINVEPDEREVWRAELELDNASGKEVYGDCFETMVWPILDPATGAEEASE